MAEDAQGLTDQIGEVFRRESGKIVASLIRILGSFEASEDVVHEAFTQAMTEWPKNGMPDNPGAWIRTTARNRALDRLRRKNTRMAKQDALKRQKEAGVWASFEAPDPEEIRDDQLRLIFTCCHPILTRETQVALTLRTLGGLLTPEIARAFLVPEKTMAQRLVRAKIKIKQGKIAYVVPPKSELNARLEAVLSVVYLIFNEGYSASLGASLSRRGLAMDAIRLGATLRRLLPASAEVLGLCSLMLLHDARRESRQGSDGQLILLSDQDRSKWNQKQIAQGQKLLDEALSLSAPGPYQIQAAIAALHVSEAGAELTDWRQIAALYGALYRHMPSPVVALNRGVAIAMHEGPRVGLNILDEIGTDKYLKSYYLYHSARADLLRRLGRLTEAVAAYKLAIELSTNEAERSFLENRLMAINSQLEN